MRSLKINHKIHFSVVVSETRNSPLIQNVQSVPAVLEVADDRLNSLVLLIHIFFLYNAIIVSYCGNFSLFRI